MASGTRAEFQFRITRLTHLRADGVQCDVRTVSTPFTRTTNCFPFAMSSHASSDDTVSFSPLLQHNTTAKPAALLRLYSVKTASHVSLYRFHSTDPHLHTVFCTPIGAYIPVSLVSLKRSSNRRRLSLKADLIVRRPPGTRCESLHVKFLRLRVPRLRHLERRTSSCAGYGL